MFWSQRNKNKKFNREDLLKAIERAGESLRTILDDPKISLRIVENKNSPIIEDYKRQWVHSNWWDQLKEYCLGWTTFIPDFKKVEKRKTFWIAIYDKDNLSGLCEIEIEKNLLKKNNVTINSIEGKPDALDRFVGYIIPAFSQVTLEIAKEFKYEKIDVLLPEKGTVPAYIRAGYNKKAVFLSSNVSKSVEANTELNWQNIFERQHQKGRYVPKGAFQ